MIREAEAQARKSKQYSESTLHKMHQKLRQVLQDAYLNEIIPRNPADLVPFARPKPKSERTSLTPEEAARLFHCAEEEGGAYGTALMLLIATGMRRGEAIGLTWKYVDLDNERLMVAHQYGTDKTLRTPKTEKSRRWVSIKGHITEVLCAWKEEQESELAKIAVVQTEDTPVFTSELGTFIDPNNFDRWWRNFSVDNGFGEFTRDVRTNRMNGKDVTRGKGYKGLKIHELRYPNQNKIPTPAAHSASGLVA